MARLYIVNDPTLKHDDLIGEIDRLREELHIPGLSVALIRNQDIEFATGLGYSDRDHNLPATPETPYHLASLTKPFSAAVIMKLVEHGRLDLDQPVSDVLREAEFALSPDKPPVYGYRNVCRQLRALSDEPDIPFAAMMRGYNGDRETVTIRHHLTHTSEGRPGTVYHYNGFLFGFLSKVVQSISGRAISDLIAEWIIGPLNMANTLPSPDPTLMEPILERRTTYYTWNKEAGYAPTPWPRPSWRASLTKAGRQVTQKIGASSGMVSTVLDLARFDAAMDNDEIVAPQSKAEMYTSAHSNSGTVFPYGLGWFVQSVDGQKIIWHYGYEPGAYSSLWLKMPAADRSLILLANSDGASQRLGLGIGDVLQSPFARLFISWVMHDMSARGFVPKHQAE